MREVRAGFSSPGPGLMPRTLAGSIAGPRLLRCLSRTRARRLPAAGLFFGHEPAPPRTEARVRAATSRANRPSAARWLGYAAVFAVAFAVRLAVAMGLSDLPLARMPELDSSQYLAWAGWIADGNHAWPQPTIQGPAYPYFLAALMWLTGGSLAAVAVWQGALGALSCVITAALASRWFGRRTGLAAGLLQAVQGPLAFVETSLYCEGLLIFFILLSMYVFTTRRATASGAVAAGVVLGAAAITRATALVLLPVYVGILAVDATSWRLRWRRVAALAAGTASLVVFVAARNASDPSGSFQIQGFAGLNFYIGNSPAGSGTATVRLGAGWENLWGEASRAGLISPASQDRYYLRKTFGENRRGPVGFCPGAWLESDVVRSGRRDQGQPERSFLRGVSPAPAMASGIRVASLTCGRGNARVASAPARAARNWSGGRWRPGPASCFSSLACGTAFRSCRRWRSSADLARSRSWTRRARSCRPRREHPVQSCPGACSFSLAVSWSWRRSRRTSGGMRLVTR